MPTTSNSPIKIEIMAGASVAPAHLDEAARALLDELSNIPQLSATLAAGETAPAGSKAIATSLPEIIMALGAAGALLPTIVNTVRDWLIRQPPATTIKIKDGDFELEWSGATPPAAIAESAAQLLARRTG